MADMIAADRALTAVVAADKAALFDVLAATAAAISGQSPSLIVERLLQREALGTTGFGGGAAIPHARIAGLAAVTVVLAQLENPVDYGAIDEIPVDIAVLLLSPEGAGADHLKALARISRALRDPATLATLRSTITARAA